MSTQPAPDQRLAAGEPDLADAEPASTPIVISRTTSSSVSTSAMRQPVEALGRHAVGAAQVAAVGQRHPQVGRHPAERVGQRSLHAHRTSLGGGGHPRPTSLTVRPIASNGATPVSGLRFLVSRRWVLFARRAAARLRLPAARSAGSATGWRTRKASNAIIRTNQKAAPAPVDRRARARRATRRRATSTRVVSATGTYDAVAHGDRPLPDPRRRRRRRHRRPAGHRRPAPRCWSTGAGSPTGNRG